MIGQNAWGDIWLEKVKVGREKVKVTLWVPVIGWLIEVASSHWMVIFGGGACGYWDWALIGWN